MIFISRINSTDNPGSNRLNIRNIMKAVVLRNSNSKIFREIPGKYFFDTIF